MKKLTLLVLTLFTTTIITAQTVKENLQKDFNSYLELILNEEFEKSMDYLIDDLFEIIPKEQLIVVMKQVYNNPAYEFEISAPKTVSISDVEKVNEKHYAILTYSSLIKMTFHPQVENETLEAKNSRLSAIKASLNDSLGKENVTLNTETDAFEVKSVKKVCSQSLNGIDKWKFITVEEEQKAILKQFIPEEIMAKI